MKGRYVGLFWDATPFSQISNTVPNVIFGPFNHYLFGDENLLTLFVHNFFRRTELVMRVKDVRDQYMVLVKQVFHLSR